MMISHWSCMGRSCMGQATDIKQEMRRFRPTVNFMLNCGWESFHCVAFTANAFSAEARLAVSASCVFSDASAAAMDDDTPRAKADNQQSLDSIALRPRDGFTSRIRTQAGAPRGLGSHTLKNSPARLSVVCCPEINCCGTAVGDQI